MVRSVVQESGVIRCACRDARSVWGQQQPRGLTHGLKLLCQLWPLLQHGFQVCPVEAVQLHVAAGHHGGTALLAQKAAVLAKVLTGVQVPQVPTGGGHR